MKDNKTGSWQKKDTTPQKDTTTPQKGGCGCPSNNNKDRHNHGENYNKPTNNKPR